MLHAKWILNSWVVQAFGKSLGHAKWLQGLLNTMDHLFFFLDLQFQYEFLIRLKQIRLVISIWIPNNMISSLGEKKRSSLCENIVFLRSRMCCVSKCFHAEECCSSCHENSQNPCSRVKLKSNEIILKYSRFQSVGLNGPNRIYWAIHR